MRNLINYLKLGGWALFGGTIGYIGAGLVDIVSGPSPEWLPLTQMLLTFSVACFVAYVGYQQWQVNRRSLNEKLFDRRMEIVEKTREFLSLVQKLKPIDSPTISQFHDVRKQAQFLFPVSTNLYLKKVHHRTIDLNTTFHHLSSGSYPNQDEELRKQGELTSWLVKQHTDCLDIFQKDMSLFN